MPNQPDRFDVIIIGSGAGGAPIAHTLANAGKSVLVIEKGPFYRPQADDPFGLSDYKRDELISDGPEKRLTIPGLANTGASFYTSHVEPDLNDEPHIYRKDDSRDFATIEGYTCQCVGGGTQHYGGVSLRFSPLDFRLKSFNEGRTDLRNDPSGDVKREARDWPITYDDLEPYYSQAEKLIGINGTRENQVKRASNENYQKPLDPNPISEYARVGMVALGMKPYRTPQAVITQDHEPSGRKVGPLGDPGVGGRPENGVREPLRRRARFQIEHLGCVAAANLEEAEPRALAKLSCYAPRMSGLENHEGEPARPKWPSAKPQRQGGSGRMFGD